MEITNWDLYLQKSKFFWASLILTRLREDLNINQEIQKAQKWERADRCPELPNDNWCNSTPWCWFQKCFWRKSRKYLTMMKRNIKMDNRWARSHTRIYSVAINSILKVFGREAMVIILTVLRDNTYSSGFNPLSSP